MTDTTAYTTISGTVQEISEIAGGQGATVMLQRCEGEVIISGLTDDEARAFAPFFGKCVTLTIGEGKE